MQKLADGFLNYVACSDVRQCCSARWTLAEPELQ